ncbi:MAG: serine/threonine-protein kinase [Gemmatimonadota bacterium]|nr:serine/threonine-protein kinase [Gemmatimonadota bacterium]
MSDDKNPPDAERTPSERDVVWDRWREVDRLLEHVLDLPEHEREGYLRASCSDDPALAATVLSLAAEVRFEALGPGERVLRAALGEEIGIVLDDPEELVGTRAGAYRLVRVLGTGGMGSVYAAERADEAFERSAAVKVLRRSATTQEVVERFELERQILASLNHPAIAQLIDGGVTPDGRPFLVMELVDGLRIDEWADRHRLGVDERIRLILGVMEAVEHAHRHMVVHRDLKPSNILVREDGSVKLLDFGIARLLQEPTGLAAATRTGGRFLTPEYAAPEQLLGEPASTQTDVYSIAILLYELLTGGRPYGSHPGSSVLEQVVRGGEPTAPSAALPPANTSGAPAGSESLGPAAVYAARATSHVALRRRLRGDLDAILMRALRARPSERYSTVAAFREDIERHLAGHAVLARGDARGYRLRRFVRRYRWPVMALGGVFLLVSGSALGLAIQRDDLIEQRTLAEQASARATREAETARATTDFLVNLFESNDPSERLGDTLTARALLGRGVARIDSELGDQPAIRAELLATLGDVHVGLGWREQGIALHERAVALARDSVSEPTALGKGLLGLADALQANREFDRAREVYGEAIRAGSPEGDSLTVAWARIGLGRTLSFLDQPDEAAVELRAGLQLLPDFPDRSEEAWYTQRTLAGIVRRQGDLEAADSLLAGIVAARRVATVSDGLLYARALNDLAVVRRMRGFHEEAARLYEEAIDSADVALGPGHPETLMFRGNFATTLTEAGRFEYAVAVYERSVRATREAWPEGHWRTASQLMQLGATLIRAGRPEEAVQTLSVAVDLAIEHIGTHHSWTNVYRAWLGVAAALTGRDAGAARLFAWSLEGLGSYDELTEDRSVVAMIDALVSEMLAQDLGDEAAPFAALLEDGPGR